MNTQQTPRHGGLIGAASFAIVAIILLVAVFIGDVVRDSFGRLPTPNDPGLPPVSGQQPKIDFPWMASPPHLPELKSGSLPFGGGGDAMQIIPATPETNTQPARVVRSYADESQGRRLAAELERHLRGLDWGKVEQTASQLQGLDIPPELQAKIRHHARSARQIENLFRKLDDASYGLRRHLATHPNCLEITTRAGQTAQVVPIRSMDDHSPINAEDPAAYVQQQLEAGNTVTAMDVKGIPTTYTRDKVDTVRAANTAGLKRDKRQEFASVLRNMEAQGLKDEAIALYDAARFAYGYGIDEAVARLLDRALVLNPDLAEQVREDQAQPLFDKMIQALEAGNKTAAAGFLASLKRSHADTNITKQAQAYYDGNLARAAEVAIAARAKMEEARRQELQQRRELAELAKDQRLIAEVDELEGVILAEAAAAADLVNAEASVELADGLFKQGEQIYAQAIAAGNTSKRDDLYGESEGWFNRALKVYSKLVQDHPDNQDYAAKMVRCNQLRYGSIKQRRSGGY
jgi:hypothetical protein